MSKFEVGDLVKGLPESNIYGLTKAVVKKVDEKYIEVKILEHKLGHTGIYTVEAKCFEKIGRIEPFDREKFLDLLKESNAKAIEYLIDADLRYANLSNADLSDANLSGANLIDANLSGANLSNADLSGANLSNADLRYADLSGANLIDANLSGANLIGANLSGANLIDANLSGANLIDANLIGANLIDANLIDANLSNANLINANLINADLSNANLRYADLRGADLSGSQGLLDAINYMEANFERTDEGYIVYKIFNENCSEPEAWKIEPGEIIEETVNCDRTIEYGCGSNVAPLELVEKYGCNQPYKLLIRWEWLPGVVVPYNTDGKIRCSKAQILEAVE